MCLCCALTVKQFLNYFLKGVVLWHLTLFIYEILSYKLFEVVMQYGFFCNRYTEIFFNLWVICSEFFYASSVAYEAYWIYVNHQCSNKFLRCSLMLWLTISILLFLFSATKIELYVGDVSMAIDDRLSALNQARFTRLGYVLNCTFCCSCVIWLVNIGCLYIYASHKNVTTCM